MDQNLTRQPFRLINPAILFPLLGLYLTSFYSFLLFHVLAEFFSILVAFSIFTISWNARRLLDGSYLVLLGIAYLCVGSIDLLHTLAFKGMGVFTAYDTNLPTQLWIAARIMESFSLFAVPLLIKRKINPEKTFALYLVLTSALIGLIFGRVFPDCYIEGIGLTPFKKISEFVICAVLLLTILLMVRKRNDFEPSIFNLLIASIGVSIATELSFIAYINVYGYEHIIGHLLKVLSFYLIYRAIVVTSIANPYDSLFWDLNQTKERLRLFIEHAPAALAMFDRNMRYLSVSRHWRNDYNLGDRDLLGISHYEVFPEIPQTWQEIHRRGLAGEVIRSDDDRFVRADGSVQRLRWEVRPWRDTEGGIAGIVIFTEDITERKRVEEELYESRSRLDLALRSADMGVWYWDLIENRRWFDDQVCHLLGIDPAKFNGTTEAFFNLVHPDDRPAVREALARAIEQHKPYETEYRAVHPDGSIHHVTARGTVACDENGRPVRLNGILWDITERKQIEDELRRSRDGLELRVRERTAELNTTIARLEQLNQELQEFAYIASHDLQEPLRKIQTFGDMAKKRCAPLLDKTGRDYLDRVLNSAGRMRELLRDLLRFSRVASKKEPFKEIELASIVREAAEVFEARVKETGSRIDIENLPVLEADASQMLQLFQNLIGNALKFRGNETPRIRIYGQAAGPGICEISVRDNGIGFDPAFAELIFKPFERLHGRSKYEGTGMGLSICRKIVERHGATIRVESQPGQGATFIIALPLKQDRGKGLS